MAQTSQLKPAQIKKRRLKPGEPGYEEQQGILTGEAAKTLQFTQPSAPATAPEPIITYPPLRSVTSQPAAKGYDPVAEYEAELDRKGFTPEEKQAAINKFRARLEKIAVAGEIDLEAGQEAYISPEEQAARQQAAGQIGIVTAQTFPQETFIQKITRYLPEVLTSGLTYAGGGAVGGAIAGAGPVGAAVGGAAGFATGVFKAIRTQINEDKTTYAANTYALYTNAKDPLSIALAGASAGYSPDDMVGIWNAALQNILTAESLMKQKQEDPTFFTEHYDELIDLRTFIERELPNKELQFRMAILNPKMKGGV